MKKDRDLARWLGAGFTGLLVAGGLTYWLSLGFWFFVIVFFIITALAHSSLLKDEAMQVTVDSQDRKIP